MTLHDSSFATARNSGGFAVFVDPGVSKGHGVAVFHAIGKLAAARLDDATVLDLRTRDPRVVCAVIEMPEEAFGGTVNTIIQLARAAERAVAAYMVAGVPVVYIPPSGSGAWKAGSKAQHQYNAWHALDPREQSLIAEWCAVRGLRKLLTPAAIESTLRVRCANAAGSAKPGEWLLGNVLDAVYLGLWAHGRIDKFGRKGDR